MTAPELWGIFGRPWIDLSSLIDTSAFPALDREITRGLCQVETTVTGGSLKWMGVVAPWQMGDGHRDLMDAVQAMTPDELEDLVALADDPSAVPEDRAGVSFGDETDHPLNRAQARLLEVRHGVYFPWKTCFHFVENHRWEDKHAGEGKRFAEGAERVFPETVAFIRRLPFREIGRAVLFGLEAHDHAPLHRDTEPGSDLRVAQSVSFAPRPGKRFYLQNREDDPPTVVSAPVYWFNDMDRHGVLADPAFRYSIRVDGVLEPRFLAEVERLARRR